MWSEHLLNSFSPSHGVYQIILTSARMDLGRPHPVSTSSIISRIPATQRRLNANFSSIALTSLSNPSSRIFIRNLAATNILDPKEISSSSRSSIGCSYRVIRIVACTEGWRCRRLWISCSMIRKWERSRKGTNMTWWCSLLEQVMV
jgi:hypothetical protein